jgi:hypothetical protein
MKRSGWVALFIAVNLYGCAVGVQPKYKITISKQRKPLPPNEWCSLTFTFTNTRSFQTNVWIEARVLDAENSTVDERFVAFATPERRTDQRETLIYTTCNRIRQVVITGNSQIVEPDSFVWEK